MKFKGSQPTTAREKPPETYREQLARQRNTLPVLPWYQQRVGVCVAIVMVLVFLGIVMAGF